jgi:general secretion pathway protein G
VFHHLFERYGEIQSRRNDESVSEKGFTLIELLIVIVVLGILAAIVIFSLTSVTGSSASAACNADAKTVETAVQAYLAQNNATALPSNIGITGTGDTSLVSTYLHTWPNPGTGAHYHILYDTTNGVEVQIGSGSTATTTAYDAGGACNGA